MEEKDPSTGGITITRAHLAHLRDKLLQSVGANSPTIGTCPRELDIELFRAFNPDKGPIVSREKSVTWDHLRTSNPIESVFATVRHRTVRTKGSLSPKTACLMVFKLVCAAAKTWRRLKGENQLPKVVRGIKFHDGVEVIDMPVHHAA